MSERVAALVAEFRRIERDRMQGLPFLNANLEVEAVGFEETDEHEIGVLVSPWFINLVLLPGSDEWDDAAQGDVAEWTFPSGKIDFTVCQDETLGTYLTAVLFRAVVDFPDQATARAVAAEVIETLRRAPDPDAEPAGKRVSRRELFTQLGTS